VPIPNITWPQAIAIGIIAGTLAGAAAAYAQSRTPPCPCLQREQRLAEAAVMTEPAASPNGEAPNLEEVDAGREG